MEQNKVSQEEFTAAIKMSQSWCSRFLSGEIKDPRRKTVEKIADFFKVTYEYLTTGEMADSQGGQVTSVNALILINRIIALDSKGLLNQSLYNALSTTLDLVSASQAEEQVVSEECKGPRSAGPAFTPDGKPIMGNSDETEDKFDTLIATQAARTNKKTG
ncbi:hypothetical protein VN23_09130 [Janthinobacterium sp. B9-8]|nr:hypothetical protein VN23_09130 [Janthinobacterium sp. B9-8]